VRSEFREIIASLADLPFRRRGLTTNGHHLRRHLAFLRDAGWDNINISVDSLDPGKFARITGGGDLRAVLDALERAVVLGFEVKVNAVMFKGVNDDELADFAAWSAQTGIEVRFLEYMKIGPQFESHWNRFLSAAEMLERLALEFRLSPAPAAPDATAFIRVTDQGGRLGFIASESQPFCGTCSRLRLSATGMLRSCLMREQGISIRHAPREGYLDILEQVLGMKPAGRLHHVDQPMHAIGG
jgi:cyclic pyranopterin phosphate synthase